MPTLKDKVKTPARFLRRLKTLAARQAKIRDELRELVAEVEEFGTDNDEAKEALDTAIDALSRLA